jgi:hypothetical protein
MTAQHPFVSFAGDIINKGMAFNDHPYASRRNPTKEFDLFLGYRPSGLQNWSL